MKRFTKALAALMLTTAVICSAGCKKEINGGNNGNDATDTLLYTIGVTAVPSNGGSVSGGGDYKLGQSCTVTASPADGYAFSDWTEHGSRVSTDATYTFTVDGSHNLVANFTADNGSEGTQTYTINVSARPIEGGIVTGRGTFQEGQSCTVTATANYYYLFENWTEDDLVVSTDANFTFTVTCSRSLVANFTYNGAPEGAINGKFSINANGDMVYFSQGNLQYNAGDLPKTNSTMSVMLTTIFHQPTTAGLTSLAGVQADFMMVKTQIIRTTNLGHLRLLQLRSLTVFTTIGVMALRQICCRQI